MKFNQSQSIDIAESLQSFGLLDSEQKAYLLLLELGATTATPVSRALRVPLTTAQSLLQRLAEKGVAEVSKKKSRSTYTANDPSVLRSILERKLKDVSEIIPLLKTVRPENLGQSKIRIFTRERVADIFHEALEAKDKLVYEIVSARDLQDVLGERFHFTRRRVAGGIRLRSLRIEANEIKKYSQQAHIRELRETKFLPRELTFKSSVLFWDNKVAFFSPAKEGLAWVTESPSIKQMWLQIFELLWSVSRRMENS